MRIKGNGIGIGLGLIAVAIAASGTAYAVTATTVNIADPSTPANIAKVDGRGHLSTAGQASTINAWTFASVPYTNSPNQYQHTTLTSPTTADLAVTSLTFVNTSNAAIAHSTYIFGLERITVGSTGSCNDSDATYTEYRYDTVAQGGFASAPITTPLLITAAHGKPYCIGLIANTADFQTPPSGYYPTVSLSAYIARGSYSGYGTNAATRVGPHTSAQQGR